MVDKNKHITQDGYGSAQVMKELVGDGFEKSIALEAYATQIATLRTAQDEIRKWEPEIRRMKRRAGR